jgi:PAS domain S-box-containing protein
LAQWWSQAYPETAYRDQVAAEWQRRVARCRRQGTPFEAHEVKVRCRDGTARIVVIEMVNLPGSLSEVDLVALHDITERKRVELALKQFNAELEQRVQERTAEALDLYHNAPCGYHMVGPDGIVLQMNDTELRWLGYAREEVEGRRHFSDLMTPASAAAFAERFGEFRDQASRGVWEWEMRCQDGSSITFLVHAEAVRDAAGRFLRSRCAVLNITERKRVELALRESEERFRSIVESSPVAMYFYHLEATGRLVLTGANPSADRIVGIAHKDLVGKSIEEVFPNLAQTAIPEMYRNVALEKIGAQQFEIPYRDDRFAGYYTVNVFWTGRRTIAVSFLDISDRRRVETALRESEERLRTIFDSSLDAILTADTAGRCVDCNPAAITLFGFPDKAALLARSLLDLAPARQSDGRDSREHFAQRMAEIMATGGAAFAWDLRHADGTVFPSEVSIALTEIQGQKVFHGIVRDVSARREAEARVRRSEEKLRIIYETSRDAIITLDVQGRCLDCNPAALAMFGCQEEQALLHRELVAFSPPRQPDGRDSRVAFLELLPHVLAQGSATLEWYLQRLDGTVFPVEISISVGELDGQPTLYGIGRDITQRKQAETQLHQLQSAVEQSPTVVVITDLKADIEYVNPRFAEQTGYTASEVLGKNPRLLQSGLHAREFYRELWQTLLAGQTWRGELCNRRKDGFLFWEFAAIAPIRDRAGRLTHFVAIKEDITERRRLAGELREARDAAEAANHAKSIFLANMSHEIRTPMNAILGFSQLLLRDAVLSGPQQRQLATIQRSGEHLLAIINGILEMARIEAGRVALNPNPFDLHRLLDDLERLFSLRAQAKQLRFLVERQGPVPRYLVADDTKLRQILTNLLGNAVKFTPNGGTVGLCVRTEAEPDGSGGRLFVQIEDTGPGIAPEDLPRLFKPFFQTQHAAQIGGGTGLGLAISRELVRLMGGECTVQSQVGVGSTFAFDVRVEQVEENFALAETMPVRKVLRLRPDLPACRLLVADDDIQNRDLLEQMLLPIGFEIRTAVDGAQAVAQCQAWRPHLVLMDLRMPVMDGYEATRRIRAAHGPAVKILALSAGVLAENRQQALAAGADAFLGKPFHEAELLETIQGLAGVDYLRQAPPGTASLVPPPTAAQQPSVESIRRLPEALVAALRAATGRADYDQMLILVDEIAAQDESLGQQLRQLVQGFDYGELQKVLSA